MPTKNIDCLGQITDTGQLQTIDKGFLLSSSETYPTFITPNTVIWSVTNPVDPSGNFQDIVTGLTQATDYYINAYAINSMGTSYSPMAEKVKTTGIINVYPTVSIGVTCGGVYRTVYEMGTYNSLVVTGVTVANDETIFTNAYINQNGSQILSWTGFKAIYSSADPPGSGYVPNTPITIGYLPQASTPSTWSVIHEVFYNCGNPQYQISSSITSEAVFPIGWVLKGTPQSSNYFNPLTLMSPYFYSDISATPNPTQPANGKLIEKSGEKILMVTPNPTQPANGKLIEKSGEKILMVTPKNSLTSWLIIGAPVEYGIIQYSLDGSTWALNPPQSTFTVSTGNVLFPQPSWAHSYKVLQYQFTKYSSTPIPFWIRFA